MFCLVQKSNGGGKWGVVAWEGVLVGYSGDSPAYKVWDPESPKVYNIGDFYFDEGVEAGKWRAKAQQDNSELECVEIFKAFLLILL